MAGRGNALSTSLKCLCGRVHQATERRSWCGSEELARLKWPRGLLDPYAAIQLFRTAPGAVTMPATASAKKFTIVPPEIWAALRLKPGAPVQWEVRGDEAVMRPADTATVDKVFGMLRKHVKPANRTARSPTEMRAGAKAYVTTKYRQSQNDAE